jgi:hypothetical protein
MNATALYTQGYTANLPFLWSWGSNPTVWLVFCISIMNPPPYISPCNANDNVTWVKENKLFYSFLFYSISEININ